MENLSANSFFYSVYQTGIKNALLHIAPCDTSRCSVRFQLTAHNRNKINKQNVVMLNTGEKCVK